MRSERSRLDRSYLKCRCGNVAGVGQTLCGACRAREEMLEEARDERDRLRSVECALESGANDAETLRVALLTVVQSLLKGR